MLQEAEKRNTIRMGKRILRIDVVTLFPGFFVSPLNESIVKIAQEKERAAITVHNLRDYTKDRHRTCDDKPFGGGPGMVMKPEPIFECIEAVRRKATGSPVIYLTPQGVPLRQQKLEALARLNGFILLCGHYEGIDQRVRDHMVDEELSVGDYVLTGGEPAALCVIDGVVRLLPGVLGNEASLHHESFQHNRLDYPHYTRPREYRGFMVPEVLISGDHKEVETWRHMQALQNTRQRRSDLLSEQE